LRLNFLSAMLLLKVLGFICQDFYCDNNYSKSVKN
jgi:hypothetical protein